MSRVARDLYDGFEHVRGLFAAGELSARKVTAIVAAASDLDGAERMAVDELLARETFVGRGIGTLRDLTLKFVAQVAPATFLARHAAARSSRRVTLRPSSDGMTDLIAHLPAEQGAACYASLCRAYKDASVSREPLTRVRGQVMADALVERVTGQATAEAVDVAVQVVVPVEAIVDPDCPLPAEIPGHGPVPAGLLTTATGRKTWRRLVTRDGIVLGGDTAQRGFTRFLTDLISARDGYRCTESYCDAPARQRDHIDRWSEGGQTGYENSRSVCEFHNYVREGPGWHVERTPDGIRTTTPTGHRHVHPPSRHGAAR